MVTFLLYNPPLGKTTLADSLISYNNIISHKQAGQIRLLDSREDEQERLITMKASSISIIYRPSLEPEKYLVNLIDSPGHVDFSFEVSSALRLSDGAIVLVDALESVCQQTVTVIRQAWEEKVKMCLVINKIDRLPFHLSMNPIDGYNHIKGILQQVNAEISALITMQINVMIANDPSIAKQREDLIAKMEEEYYFAPEKGNVP
jgi:ribosome assembly protein 1